MAHSEYYTYDELDKIVSIMDSKHSKGYGLRVLEEYVKHGKLNVITRTDNIRDKIRLIPKEIIDGYIRRNKNM